jgi:hypothetical protein
MPQQCLAPEGGVVLKQIINVTDPIILLAGTGALAVQHFSCI